MRKDHRVKVLALQISCVKGCERMTERLYFEILGNCQSGVSTFHFSMLKTQKGFPIELNEGGCGVKK